MAAAPEHQGPSAEEPKADIIGQTCLGVEACDRPQHMTYCLAIAINEGLVFSSDSRTNAGADQVRTYSKMRVFGVPGDRQFVLLAGQPRDLPGGHPQLGTLYQ